MKEPLIYKTELLTRLNEIYDQLEKLEAVLHSSYLQQHGHIQTMQNDQLDNCSRRLTVLENEVANQFDEKKNAFQAFSNPCKRHSASIQLELGLKSV
ncbi:hypothetical protein [Neobacillus sp. LXY-4]|uniref:hypothetical protein n=1 Tax=Neobacillus sp. LXY-4 TaxID=3379826 RepID=UPI003EE1D62B